MIAKCGNNGCVYWARIQDPTQVIRGTSYYQCGACNALHHDPSDQRTPLLPPSVLVAAPKWQGKVPRIWQMGCYPYRTASASGGAMHRRPPPEWRAVKKVRMYTKSTNHTTEPPSDGACWVPEGR